MKKVSRYCTLACLLQDVLNKTFTVQNKPAAVAPKETITHHFFVSGIGRKTVDAAKICGGAENVVKTETQQTFVNGLLRFYYFRHLYSFRRVCIAHNNCMSYPSIWATLSALLIQYNGSFQLFLHSDQPLSEGEIIPFSGVCQSGGCIIHAGGGGSFTLTDRLL